MSKALFSFLLVIAVLFIPFKTGVTSTTMNQSSAPVIRLVRSISVDETGIPNPEGLAYSKQNNNFFVMSGNPQGLLPPAKLDMFQLDRFADRSGLIQIADVVEDPINIAFDNKADRLLSYQNATKKLIEVSQDPEGNLDSANLIQHDIRRFRVQDPQGLSVDEVSGDLFILDAESNRIVKIGLGAGGSFTNAPVTFIDLNPVGTSNLRGLAVDPSTGHFFVVSPNEQKLYELTQAGKVETVRGLSEFGLANPKGIVFAPSGDQTDDPTIMNLFLADSGDQLVGEPNITSSSPGWQVESQAMKGISDIQTPGKIVELSLTPSAAPLAVSFISNTVNTTDLALPPFSPPSPDPSGLTYKSSTNTLLMSDSEVEEIVSGITHFQGVNVWEYNLDGSLVVDTANISNVPPTNVPMSNEPAGIAWNPSNGHIFISDDDTDLVYDLDPGIDHQIGTADDTRTSFSVRGVGSGDPEGLAFDPLHDWLFVADGVNAEIYKFSLSGDLLGQFDTEQYGVINPQSVEFNAASGTLFVLSNGVNKVIAETTLSGVILRTIDISPVNVHAANGFTFAPASDGSGANRFYILERGIDNDFNPNIIDGKMFEVTAPALITPGNLPPDVDAGPDQDINWPTNSVNLNGTVSDDNIPDPPEAVTTIWSKISGPCTVTFGNAAAVDTTANFLYPGRYILQLDASDSELNSWDTLNVDVTLPGTQKNFNVHLEASTDDAEEELAGPMTIIGTRIELGERAGEAQTAGFRFNWLGIPPGATILNAYIQFKVNQTSTGAASITIKGQASDHAPTFGFTQFDITNRVTTTASVPWSPPAWNNVGDQGPDQRTPNLAVLVQEIVDRPGWLSGNSAAFIITGTGMRVAEAYDGDPCGAAVLHIEYDVPPVANANGPYHATVGFPEQFDGTGSNDPDGTIVSYDWDFGDGNTGTGSNPAHTYTSDGNYTVTLTVTDDAGLTDVDQTSANTQNHAPIAFDDAYKGSINVTLNVMQLEGVLKNDIDPDLDNLTAMKVTNPSNGTLEFNGNGSFVYTPDSEFYGMDSFTYKVFDGLTYSNTATVMISVMKPVFLPLIFK